MNADQRKEWGGASAETRLALRLRSGFQPCGLTLEGAWALQKYFAQTMSPKP